VGFQNHEAFSLGSLSIARCACVSSPSRKFHHGVVGAGQNNCLQLKSGSGIVGCHTMAPGIYCQEKGETWTQQSEWSVELPALEIFRD